MPVFTVHAPQGEASADRTVFIRDGFHFWAFVFGPFWLAAHRLWLALVMYVIAMAALGIVLAMLHMAGNGWVFFLLSLLVGFEASTIWRWTLRRKGFRDAGIVVAQNREDAEHRFFHRAALAIPQQESAPATGTPQASTPFYSGANDVIGLFPEKGL